MTDKPSSKTREVQLKITFNKWRIIFLVFAICYLVFLLIDLSKMPLQWDEVVHLNNGIFLKTGQFTNFINNSFYPPLYDSFTMIFFNTLGISLVSGRLVSVVFSILTLWAVFELANDIYGEKTAIISAVLLGIMPGYFWLSRVAMLDVMLVFFFILSLLFFFRWLKNGKNSMLFLSGLSLGFGLLTKYQIVAAGVVMVVTLLVFGRHQLRRVFTKFTVLLSATALVVIPWVVIAFDIYASRFVGQWLYALQMGNPGRSMYSDRFPIPIYYFIEMTWPYSNVHPISLFLYIAGLFGVGLLVWRRQKEDKFLLIWFASIFVFFTIIENKDWRYVLPLFPALAISTAVLMLFTFSKAQNVWKGNFSANKKILAKLAAGVLIILVIGAVAFSVDDAQSWVVKDQAEIQLPQATNFAINHDTANQSIMVLCPYNLFSRDMVNFYLWAEGQTKIQTYQYPELPVDAYTPIFNITEFIGLCKQDNVKYVFTYEYGGIVPYFNTTLTLQKVYIQLYASGNFTHISPEQTFGSNPRRILILNFTG